MNKKFLLSLLAGMAAPILFYFLSTFEPGQTNWTKLGLAFFIAGFLYLQPGLIISVKGTDSYYQVGKGLVLASAILMLSGFAICSISPLTLIK